MKPRKELIWLIWKEIFNHFSPPTCLWYTRERVERYLQRSTYEIGSPPSLAPSSLNTNFFLTLGNPANTACSISTVSCTVLSHATSLSPTLLFPNRRFPNRYGEEFFFASGTVARSNFSNRCYGKANVAFGTTTIRRFVDESWKLFRRISTPQRYSTCHTLLQHDIIKWFSPCVTVRFRLGFAYRGAWKREEAFM